MSQDWTDDCFAGSHSGQEDLQNIKDNLQCLKTSFSGASAPSNTSAGMKWYDTTNHILKVRNEANNAWINLLNLSTSGNIITAGTGMVGGGDVATGITLSIDAAGISQSRLKTSFGSVSLVTGSNTSNSGNFTLPGGEYGFYPQVRVSDSSGHASITIAASTFNTTTYTTNINITGYASATGITTYARQRYVTSSGEVFWIFILRDKATKKVIASYQAPDHPCFGNGGKPLVVAHPFPGYDQGTQEIIVINPNEEDIRRIIHRCYATGEDEPDRDVIDVIMDEYSISEHSSPDWPEIPVTVGLPGGHDWKRMQEGSMTQPIKKVIPKHEALITKSMRRK